MNHIGMLLDARMILEWAFHCEFKRLQIGQNESRCTSWIRAWDFDGQPTLKLWYFVYERGHNRFLSQFPVVQNSEYCYFCDPLH